MKQLKNTLRTFAHYKIFYVRCTKFVDKRFGLSEFKNCDTFNATVLLTISTIPMSFVMVKPLMKCKTGDYDCHHNDPGWPCSSISQTPAEELPNKIFRSPVLIKNLLCQNVAQSPLNSNSHTDGKE